MREAEMREVLRELCDELDRRQRRPARGVMLASALGAALALSACSEPQPAPATDGGVDRGAQTTKDGRSVDIPTAVAMYSAPGCSFVPPWRR